MKRGTTPVHKFFLPFSAELIKDVEITYQQTRRDVLVRRLADCTLDGDCIMTTLTQEETFSFAEGGVVDIQIRVITTRGDVLASDIFHVTSERCLSEEVLA